MGRLQQVGTRASNVRSVDATNTTDTAATAATTVRSSGVCTANGAAAAAKNSPASASSATAQLLSTQYARSTAQLLSSTCSGTISVVRGSHWVRFCTICCAAYGICDIRTVEWVCVPVMTRRKGLARLLSVGDLRTMCRLPHVSTRKASYFQWSRITKQQGPLIWLSRSAHSKYYRICGKYSNISSTTMSRHLP